MTDPYVSALLVVCAVLDEANAAKEIPNGIFGLFQRLEPALATPIGMAYKPFCDKVSEMYRSATPLQTDLEREIHVPPPVQPSDCIVT